MVFGNAGVSVCLIFGILFLPTVVLSSSVFSSFADAQNSVSSKPLVRWGCISNQWKAGRVFQLFGIQLSGIIPPKQPQNLVFFQHCNLSRIAVFSKPVVVQIVIESEPLIGWRQVNTRWKSEDVLYLFGIRLSTKFQINQYQIVMFWLLLAVKTESASLPVFPVQWWRDRIESSCHTRFLSPKPDAHRMYAQDQVVIHTVRM
jgi:hypothetical protein